MTRCINSIFLLVSAMLVAASMATASDPFPARPWIQKGDAWVFETELPVGDVRHLVPAEFDIVETKAGSGLTKGAVYIVQYVAPSTVIYSEAIFICALVSYKISESAMKANWIGSIYVDNVVAQQAGIHVWGMPKHIGVFDWSKDGNNAGVRITTPAGLLVGAFNYTRNFVPIPFMHQDVKSFSVDNATKRVLLSQTEQKYTIHFVTKVDALVPATSPLGGWMAMPAGGGGNVKMGAKVELSAGTFNMSAPIEV